MLQNLNPQNAWIFRIVHRDNVPWILDHGLHCRSSATRDPNYIEIGNPDLISRRCQRYVPRQPDGTLSNYVPFYFTPYSPMLLNIVTGWGGIAKRERSEIVIMLASLHQLRARGVPFLFTDRHAYLVAAEFYCDLQDLRVIDWALLQHRNFSTDAEDPSKKERYQAEALIHKHLATEDLLGLVTYNDDTKINLEDAMRQRGMSLRVENKPSWYC